MTPDRCAGRQSSHWRDRVLATEDVRAGNRDRAYRLRAYSRTRHAPQRACRETTRPGRPASMRASSLEKPVRRNRHRDLARLELDEICQHIDRRIAKPAENGDDYK